MPAIAYIVARSHPDHIIGCDNRIPWRLRSDMKRFRSVTETNAIIMGRKTFESIGHPLPNRLNIVLSRHEDRDRGASLPQLVEGGSGGALWVPNVETALFFADLYSFINQKREIFVIGGSEIYRLFIDLFYEIYLTVVMAPELKKCNNYKFSYFEAEFLPETWKTLEELEIPASEFDEYPSRFLRLKKKKDIRHRYRDLAEFLTPDQRVAEFRERWAAKALAKPIRTEQDLAKQIGFYWPDALAG